MIILGIETSCDETALALIETRIQNNTFECRVISSLINSQAELHSPYGGVFPTLAKREHEKNLPLLLEKILEIATKNKLKIDSVAVTQGPGLEPALWTGITFATELSKKWNVPLIPVNHMEGHIIGSLLESDKPDGKWQKLKTLPLPAITLLISGGHTELVKIDHNQKNNPSTLASAVSPIGYFKYTIIGQTKDDAVGEAFDKVARLIGLKYPGGPRLAKLANEAREQNIQSMVKLPRPMIMNKDLNFSFSGLKTAVLYAIRDAEKDNLFNETYKKGLAREFEDSIAETLELKLRKAIDLINAKSMIIGGGVSANLVLRERFNKISEEYGIPIYLPSQHISGDNALMIALTGAINNPQSKENIKAQGTKRLGAN